MVFSVNRTLIVLGVLLFSIAFTIWHSRDHFGFGISLEHIRPHEWANTGGTLAKAEAIYQETLERRHNLLKLFYPDLSQMTFFPAVDKATYDVTPWTIWNFFPASYNCPFEMKRIGAMGDGGKWVCGMSRYIANKRPCVIYSFGIQDESSFGKYNLSATFSVFSKQEFLEQTNCEIWGYDSSVSKWGPQIFRPADIDTRAHFVQAAISGTTNILSDPPAYSIKDLMSRNGHKYIDIMKMNIEGSEYESISSFLNDFQNQELPVGQLLIAIHVRSDWDMTPTPAVFVNWFEELEARHMRPVWTEANLLAVTLGVSGNEPSVTEYSLINTKDRKSLLLG